MGGKHRPKAATRSEPYRWLSVGALTIGIGTSFLAGAATAHADNDGDSDASTSASDSTSAKAPNPHRASIGASDHQDVSISGRQGLRGDRQRSGVRDGEPSAASARDDGTPGAESEPTDKPLAPAGGSGVRGDEMSAGSESDPDTPGAEYEPTGKAPAPASGPRHSRRESGPSGQQSRTVHVPETSIHQPSVSTKAPATPSDVPGQPEAQPSDSAARDKPTAIAVELAAEVVAAPSKTVVTVPVSSASVANQVSPGNAMNSLALPLFAFAGYRAGQSRSAPAAATSTSTQSAIPANVIGALALPGSLTDIQTAEGVSRAIVTTRAQDDDTGDYTVFATVVNTKTGTQVGDTFTSGLITGFGITPPQAAARFIGDGSRAVIMLSQGAGALGVTILDTATAHPIGSTSIVAGDLVSDVKVLGDGRTTLISTTTGDALMPTGTSVTFFDAATGAVLAPSTALPGGLTGVQISADGTRAVVQTRSGGFLFGGTTTTAILDTASGQQVGTAFQQSIPSGFAAAQPTVTIAGNTAMFTTYDVVGSNLSGTITAAKVSFVNLETGLQIGSTVAYPGGTAVTTALSADGRVATVTSVTTSVTYYPGTTFPIPGSAVHTTVLETFNASTGQPKGDPLVLAGAGAGDTRLNATGTRAVVSFVSDGQTATKIAIIDTTTGHQLGSTTIAGSFAYSVADSLGTRDIFASYNTDGTAHITVLDIINATTLSSFDIAGAFQRLMLDPGETRAIVVTDGHLSVIDTASGQPLNTIDSAGIGNIQFSPDGSRTVFITSAQDTHSDGYGTAVAVLDTATGRLLGATHLPTGNVESIQLSPDGTRTVVVSQVPNASGSVDTRLIVIDTVKGTQVGPALAFANSELVAVKQATHGDRAVLTIRATTAEPSTSTIVVDTSTGRKVNATVIDPTVAEVVSATLTPDGARLLLNVRTTGTGAEQLVVIDANRADAPSSPDNPLAILINRIAHQITSFVTQVGTFVNSVSARIGEWAQASVRWLGTAVNIYQQAAQAGNPNIPGPHDPDSEEEKAWEAFNGYTGWIPVWGTFINAASVVMDGSDFIEALRHDNSEDIADEAGDLVGDLIGIPLGFLPGGGLIRDAMSNWVSDRIGEGVDWFLSHVR